MVVVGSVTNAFAISVSHSHLNLHFYFDIHIFSPFFLVPIYLNYLAAFENFPYIKYQLIKIAQKHINKIYCYSCRTHTDTHIRSRSELFACSLRIRNVCKAGELPLFSVSVKLNVKIVLKIKHKYLLRTIEMLLSQGIRMPSLGLGKCSFLG